MKFFTFYSKSHKPLLDLFSKSFLKNCESDLIIRKIKQKCNGDYHSSGWKDSMKDKVKYILDSLDMCKEGEVMIHADSDIIFRQGCEQYIQQYTSENDISFQWDSAGICMGFFCCKNIPIVRSFFEKVYSQLDNFDDDQIAASHILKSKGFQNLKFAVFDKNVYTVGMDIPIYLGGDVTIPKNWFIFHANFTKDLKSKIELLNKAYANL